VEKEWVKKKVIVGETLEKRKKKESSNVQEKLNNWGRKEKCPVQAKRVRGVSAKKMNTEGDRGKGEEQTLFGSGGKGKRQGYGAKKGN